MRRRSATAKTFVEEFMSTPLNVPTTGNATVDNALAAQAAVATNQIVLATNTNTAVTTINGITSAARKIQPT
jgi:hypothetical protein